MFILGWYLISPLPSYNAKTKTTFSLVEVWPVWGCCKDFFPGSHLSYSCCEIFDDVVYLLLPFPSKGLASIPTGQTNFVPAIASTLPATFLPPHSSTGCCGLGLHTTAIDHLGLLLLALWFLMTLLWKWTLGLELLGRLRLALSCCCLCYWLALQSTAPILLHSALPPCPGHSFPECHHIGEIGLHTSVLHLYQALSVWLWTLRHLSEPVSSPDKWD